MPSPQKTLIALLVCAALLPQWVGAEKADRLKALEIEADQRGMVDMINRHSVVSGNVVIRQGTMLMKAHQAELRETADGYPTAVLSGAAGQAASFRQKRDGVDEYIEGSAARIEYDGKLDTVRFIGNAVLRRLRGNSVADEASGAVITYDNLKEKFSTDSDASAKAGSDGRVRIMLSPRGAEAAAASASKPSSGR
jgi:lipopolysaccharide export system protein LptA